MAGRHRHRGQPVAGAVPAVAICWTPCADGAGRSGLAPNRLELEITESVLLQNSDDRLATLHQLARAGRAHRDGRFRHRLFVAQLSAQLSLRQDQDRPLVHPRPRSTNRNSQVIVRADHRPWLAAWG